MKNNQSSHGNKIAASLLWKLAIITATLGLLAACGQRGSLYIPTTPEAAQRGTIVDTLIKPATPATAAPASSPTSAPTK